MATPNNDVPRLSSNKKSSKKKKNDSNHGKMTETKSDTPSIGRHVKKSLIADLTEGVNKMQLEDTKPAPPPTRKKNLDLSKSPSAEVSCNPTLPLSWEAESMNSIIPENQVIVQLLKQKIGHVCIEVIPMYLCMTELTLPPKLIEDSPAGKTGRGDNRSVIARLYQNMNAQRTSRNLNPVDEETTEKSGIYYLYFEDGDDDDDDDDNDSVKDYEMDNVKYVGQSNNIDKRLMDHLRLYMKSLLVKVRKMLTVMKKLLTLVRKGMLTENTVTYMTIQPSGD